jgi:hypothetical protein
MSSVPKPLTDLLGKFGISQKSLMKLRFGGVVGKQALTVFAGLVVLGVIAFRTDKGNSYLLWGCLVGVVLITLAGLGAMAFQGHRHPLEATLEGGEIVIMQHLRQEGAAKGVASIPATPPVLEGIGHKTLKEGEGN